VAQQNNKSRRRFIRKKKKLVNSALSSSQKFPYSNLCSYCLARWQQQAGLEKETGLTLCGDVKATGLYSVGQPAKRSKEINIQRHD
jgi:hypothetical protein